MITQLGAQDASFLYMEAPNQPMHIGSIAIYNPKTSPFEDFSEDEFIRLVEARLHLWPTARSRVVNVPFNLDHPYWIEDSNFDIEYHVRRIALPKPYDWQTLFKTCARIFSRPLDLTRPLREFYLIEGLDRLEGIESGCVAILSKTHHAAIDGASGVHLMELLHDLEPQPRVVEPPEEPWHPDPVPTDWELMVRTWGTNLTQPFKMAEVWAQSMPQIQKGLQRMAQLPNAPVHPVPRTRFNKTVSSHRVIGSATFELEQFREIKSAVPGATINDAVLTVCGGALREYLELKQELPSESLVCMAPVNVRTAEEQGNMGNRVSALFVPIGTDVEAPLTRLIKVQDTTSTSKAISEAVGARLMTDYNQFVPAYTAALAARLSSTFANVNQPTFNCSITNVPGPQVPLYSVGSRMEAMIGLGPITDGMGLIMPVNSYCGALSISFTSCREMIPDPDTFTACIQGAFDSLYGAIGATETSAASSAPATE